MPLSKIEQSSVNSGVAGTGPAFSAYGNAYVSASSGTYTKIPYQIVEFDTSSPTAYNNVNYRFLPKVAGYYQLNAIITASNGTGVIYITLYKNGSTFKAGTFVANNSIGPQVNISTLVYANGTTDYFEVYGYQTSGSAMNIGSSSSALTFSGSMVRAA